MYKSSINIHFLVRLKNNNPSIQAHVHTSILWLQNDNLTTLKTDKPPTCFKIHATEHFKDLKAFVEEVTEMDKFDA